MVVPSVISNVVTYSKFERIGERLDKLESQKEDKAPQSPQSSNHQLVYVPSIFRK